MDPHGVADRAARESYGRILAFLVKQSHDIAAAEDALGEAFKAALDQWPSAGVPRSPEAWLLTIARRRLLDARRREGVRHSAVDTLELITGDAASDASGSAFPDERLALMFVCAHEAIDPKARTPLMLQTVLGIDAARIAAAFLVPPSTLSQRLVRAKRKLRDAGIRFAVPERDLWPGRIGSVLDAIYAAYGTGWASLSGSGNASSGLAREAIWLASLLADLVPDEPEVQGLLSLMLFCEARAKARFGQDGRYIPLTEQDVALWSPELIARAERALRDAHRAGVPGRYQLEASIQSAHSERRVTGRTPWPAIASLYDMLVALQPSIGALTSRAAALGMARGPQHGLAALAELPASAVETYQPFWAVRAHLLAAAGQSEEAKAAYGRALGLAEHDSIRRWLRERAMAVEHRG